METKNKKRPAGTKRRPPAASGNGKRRGTSERKPGTSTKTQPRTVRTRREPTATASASRPPRELHTDAPEMVFTPGRQGNGVQSGVADSSWNSAQRNSAARSRKRQQDRRKKSRRPSVVYSQPAPIQLSKLALYLVSVLAVVVAIFLGISVFFKVKTVKVYGNKAYSAWTVREASGIEDGENLLTFGRTKASGKIIAALPYVKNARIGINLPDTVNIYIEEEDVAYSIRADNGTWWLMTSRGRIVEQIDSGSAGNYTKVLGVVLDTPAEGEQAKALEEETTQTTAASETTDETLSLGETLEVPELVTAADRLEAALEILTALEDNEIVGEAASIDVTSLVNMELWYGQQYRVRLGDRSQMDYKISCMKQVVTQEKSYQSGILDVSFTTVTDMPSLTPME